MLIARCILCLLCQYIPILGNARRLGDFTTADLLQIFCSDTVQCMLSFSCEDWEMCKHQFAELPTLHTATVDAHEAVMHAVSKRSTGGNACAVILAPAAILTSAGYS